MAPLAGTNLLLCLFFIGCFCLTATLAEVPVDCCLSVKNQQVPKGMIVDYHLQVGGQGCSLNATILVTRRQIRLCAPAAEQWVHNIVKHVKQLRKCCDNKKCKKGRKYKYCIGVRPE